MISQDRLVKDLIEGLISIASVDSFVDKVLFNRPTIKKMQDFAASLLRPFLVKNTSKHQYQTFSNFTDICYLDYSPWYYDPLRVMRLICNLLNLHYYRIKGCKTFQDAFLKALTLGIFDIEV